MRIHQWCLVVTAWVTLLMGNEMLAFGYDIIHPNRLEKPVMVQMELFEPRTNAMIVSPVRFKVNIKVTMDVVKFQEKFPKLDICIEIDRNASYACFPLGSNSMVVDVDIGTHEALARLVSSGNQVLTSSQEVQFQVGKKEDLEEISQMYRKSKMKMQEDKLLDWYASQLDDFSKGINTKSTLNYNNNYAVVILIKSGARYGFPHRAAIRNTWKPLCEKYNMKALFVLGKFNDSFPEGNRIQAALLKEKEVFNDTLTTETDFYDSYETLPQKTAWSLEYAVHTYPNAWYFMMVDDDTYIRIDRLFERFMVLGRQSSIYRGVVWSDSYAIPIKVNRDPSVGLALTEEEYPMPELIPFATCSYFVSRDCAEFIGRNRFRLHSVGYLEDVSVAVWLLTLQVHPKNDPKFFNAKNEKCSNDLISYSDISYQAIEALHRNLYEFNQPFCTGYDTSWIKFVGKF